MAIAGAIQADLKSYHYLIMSWVCLGSIAYGYAVSVIGTSLGQPSFISYMRLDTAPNASQLIGLANSLFQVGGFLGTLCLPIFADKYGRKWGIFLGAILVMIAGAGMAGSVNMAMFIAFRVISGAGSFIVLAAVPIWLNEVVPARARGALVDFHGIFICFGAAAAAWIGLGFYFYQNGEGQEWRPPLALQCLAPLCLVFGLYWVPESPRFLAMKGRDEVALEVLKLLHSKDDDPDHAVAMAELFQIQRQMELDRTFGASWKEICRKPSYLKRFGVAISVFAILQCCGQQVITNYYSDYPLQPYLARTY